MKLSRGHTKYCQDLKYCEGTQSSRENAVIVRERDHGKRTHPFREIHIFVREVKFS